MPRIEPRAGSFTLVIIFAIVVAASVILARVMKAGAAPLVAAPIGSFLGGALLWFQIEHYHGVSDTSLVAVAVLGLIGLMSTAAVVWAGRRAVFARLPKKGMSLAVSAFALSLALLVGYVGTKEIEFMSPADVRAGASAPPPVVLIVLDTVRADHLAAYGYPRDTMPALESFFAQYGLSPMRSVANSP